MNILSLTLFVVVAEAHAVDGVVAVVEALVVVDAAVDGVDAVLGLWYMMQLLLRLWYLSLVRL